MAAAIAIPLVTSILPAAIPVVVRLVERLLGKQTGPDKLDVASQIIESVQAGLQRTKQISGAPLDVSQIKALIEASVGELNQRGELKGGETQLDATIADVFRALDQVKAIVAFLTKA